MTSIRRALPTNQDTFPVPDCRTGVLLTSKYDVVMTYFHVMGAIKNRTKMRTTVMPQIYFAYLSRKLMDISIPYHVHVDRDADGKNYYLVPTHARKDAVVAQIPNQCTCAAMVVAQS